MIAACLWLAVAYGGAAQVETGKAAAERMAENVKRIPNYTCTENVERWTRGEPCAECEYRDRVRLE